VLEKIDRRANGPFIRVRDNTNDCHCGLSEGKKKTAPSYTAVGSFGINNKREVGRRERRKGH
jgi:hypothetical protein